MRLTGVGDSWNAGDLLGEVIGLPDHLRLYADAVAAYYISDSRGRHPSRQDLIRFLEGAPLKKGDLPAS